MKRTVLCLDMAAPVCRSRRMTPARRAALAKAQAAGWGKQRGEVNGAAKLTAELVQKIRRLRTEGERPSVLARRFAVDRTLIWYITTRRIWTHI